MSKIGGSRAVALAAGVLLALATYRGVAQNAISLPDFSDSSAAVISSSDERRLGEAFMRELRSSVTVVDDPEVEAYIESLGYRLSSNAGAPGQQFTFFVVLDPRINAFAAPGGFVGVNSGLLLASQSESELAAVLAHEIAHVTQRHIARRIQLAENMSIPAMAGILAAVIAGAAGGGEAGRAALAAVTAGQVQMQIDFTRANEQEADRVGIQTLAAAGYDPRAMPTFFERLQESHRYYREPPEFLSTHPVTTSRIADSRGRAETYPYRQYPDSSAFHFVRAKLRVLSEGDHQRLLQYFEGALATATDAERSALEYGQALALVKAGQAQLARARLTALAKRYPGSTVLIDALARAEGASGDARAALATYADAISLYPGNKLLTRGYVQALLLTGGYAKALDLLDEYRRNNELDAALYKLQAQAYELAQRPAEARLALAEHYYLDGRLDAAIHQLEQGSRLRGQDFYVDARVAARLKDLQAEQQARADANRR